MKTATREIDLNDGSPRPRIPVAPYPLDFIPNASKSGQPRAGHAEATIIMLTADAFGVMPPIAQA